MNQKLDIKEEAIVSTGMFIEEVTKSFLAFSNENMIYEHPAIFVKGQPGIGKSQAVKEIARRIQQETNKKVEVIDVRLLLFNPVDLRGIPVADMKKQSAIWLKPLIFNLNPNDDHIHILFLDELTAAPSSLQAAAYQIALDKKLGEHELPKNTFVIAAGNRNQDHAIAYEMPSALKNRFMHFEIEPDFDDWMSWATQNEIHEEILSFIKNNPHRLSTDVFDTESNIIITPRSWELLSKVLKIVKGSLQDNETIISSILGNSMTHLLLNKNTGINVDDVISGKITDVPQDISNLQNIVEKLEYTIDKYMNDEIKLTHVMNYIQKLPVDFGLRVFKKMAKYDKRSVDLSKIEGFKSYLERLGERIPHE
jgi:MoxR-like ATPase